MTNRFKKENLENIERLFSEETGVRFSRNESGRHAVRPVRVLVVSCCLALACAGVFAGDAGKAIIEKLKLNKPVENAELSLGYIDSKTDTEPHTDTENKTEACYKDPDNDESDPLIVGDPKMKDPEQNGAMIPYPGPGKIESDYSLAPNPDHLAIDLAAENGTPVYPVLDGKVKETGWEAKGGNYIIIEHDFGITSAYKALGEILVEPEQQVTTETQIGTVGKTGMSTGYHLHLEMTQYGEPIDPTSYFVTNNPDYFPAGIN